MSGPKIYSNDPNRRRQADTHVEPAQKITRKSISAEGLKPTSAIATEHVPEWAAELNKQLKAESIDNRRQLSLQARAIHRQVECMGCDTFEVGIRHWKRVESTQTYGQFHHEQWWEQPRIVTALDLDSPQIQAELRKLNAQGCGIFIRPVGSVGLILLDDLDRSKLGAIKKAGIKPQLIVETSPGNHQAWVRISDRPIDKELATQIAKVLAESFSGDPNAAKWRQFGRLAGFTNDKSKHDVGGRRPWSVIRESHARWDGIDGTALLDEARRRLEVGAPKPGLVSRMKGALTESPKADPRGGPRRDPLEHYRRDAAQIMRRYPSLDASKLDWMIAGGMVRAGYSEGEIATAIGACSPEVERRKGGASRAQKYATLTAHNAVLKTPVAATPSAKKNVEASISTQVLEPPIEAWLSRYTDGLAARAQTDLRSELDAMRSYLGRTMSDGEVIQHVLVGGSDAFGRYIAHETERVSEKTIENKLGRWRRVVAAARQEGLCDWDVAKRTAQRRPPTRPPAPPSPPKPKRQITPRTRVVGEILRAERHGDHTAYLMREDGSEVFRDHGQVLRGAGTADLETMCRGMFEIAQAKGWKEIWITGPPEFVQMKLRLAAQYGIRITSVNGQPVAPKQSTPVASRAALGRDLRPYRTPMVPSAERLDLARPGPIPVPNPIPVPSTVEPGRIELDIDAQVQSVLHKLMTIGAENTIRNRAVSYRAFESWCAKQSIPRDRVYAELFQRGQPMLDAFLSAERKNRKAIGTIHVRKVALGALLREARKLGLCTWKPKNIWQNRDKLIVRRDTSGVARSAVDAAVARLRLEASADPARAPLLLRNVAMVELMSRESLRSCEVADLRVQDVNLAAGQVHVYERKMRRHRTVQLSFESRRALSEYLAVAGQTTGPLFTGWDHGTRTDRPVTAHAIQTVVRYLELPRVISGGTAGSHALRHTFATEVYQKTGDLTEVGKRLGHSDAMTRSTANYIP